MPLRHAAATDVGRVRDHNEDSVLVNEELGLYVVADGMGGRAAGEIASRLAVDTVRDAVLAAPTILAEYEAGTCAAGDVLAFLGAAIQSANRAVLRSATERPDRHGMGTTITAALVFKGHVFAAHVGDSRLYLVRGDTCRQLSRDHTLLDELVLAGQITRDEANSPEMQRLRNVLARAVGVQADVIVDTFDFPMLPGDRVLLCSDGLNHYFQEAEIGTICAGDPEEAVSKFIALTNERGGHDNITVVIAAAPDEDPLASRSAFTERARAISAVPLFEGVHPRLLFHLALAAQTETVAADAVVSAAGDTPQALRIVLEGRVQFRRGELPDGEAGRDSWFGEACLVDRWSDPNTVIALEPTRMVNLTREAIMAISLREPELRSQILSGFARAIAGRTRGAHV